MRKDKTSSTTPQQALIKWVLENPYVDTTIPGMTAFEHLADDLAVMGMKLTSNEHKMLKRYTENLNGRYCGGASGCSDCINKCPKGVEVSNINRCLGYIYGYGNLELAYENYQHIPRSSRVDVCDNCEVCVVRCVQGINLDNSMKRARHFFT
jgi:predicted aldo/keto reductase-like oxidoreductase